MDRVALEFGFITIYWYAIFIVTGIAVGYFVGKKIVVERGIDLKFYDNLIFYGVLISIISARLYYVLFNLEYYLADPIKIIKVNEGGLAIHGAIISAFLFGYFYCKKHRVNFIDMFDVGAVGFMIAQAIGRWGNFFNQEAHGSSVSRAFLEKLYLPEFVINGMNIDGIYYHPTFLYESIWNVIGFVIVMIFRKSLFAKKGSIFCFYIIWYSFIRFFIESMRTDSLYWGNFKVAQVMSFIAVFFALGFYIYINKNKGEQDESSDNSIT